MTDFKQFTEPELENRSDNVTASSAASPQEPNVNPSSDITPKSTFAPIGPLQPLRPRVMPISIPPISIAPQFPVSAGAMDMESLTLVSPLASSSPHHMSAGFLRSPHDKRGRKAQRKRTTPAQLAELLKVFEANENPSHDVREMLSKKVAMTNREVQVWFQNRRAKEANMEKKHDQFDRKANRSPESSATDIARPINAANKKVQPIQAAPYPPSTPVYSYANPGANQFSAFRRMSLGITPDGRTVFFPEPTFTAPNAPSGNAQQFFQQPQPIQFMSQTPTTFLPTAGNPMQAFPVSTAGNPMQAFPAAPQMMLVPVFASPQGFLPASDSGFAYAPAAAAYSDSATATGTAASDRVREVAPKAGAEALNALARAASEQSMADSS